MSTKAQQEHQTMMNDLTPKPTPTYRIVPRIIPERVTRGYLPSIQVGGKPKGCQRNEFQVPPCALCKKRMYFIVGVDPFHLDMQKGRKLMWGDAGEYFLWACPGCFAGGKPGTYHVEGNQC